MLVEGDWNSGSIRMSIVSSIYGQRDHNHGLNRYNKKDFYHRESGLRTMSFSTQADNILSDGRRASFSNFLAQ